MMQVDSAAVKAANAASRKEIEFVRRSIERGKTGGRMNADAKKVEAMTDAEVLRHVAKDYLYTLRTRLEALAQLLDDGEPVAWMHSTERNPGLAFVWDNPRMANYQPLYALPKENDDG